MNWILRRYSFNKSNWLQYSLVVSKEEVTDDEDDDDDDDDDDDEWMV